MFSKMLSPKRRQQVDVASNSTMEEAQQEKSSHEEATNHEVLMNASSNGDFGEGQEEDETTRRTPQMSQLQTNPPTPPQEEPGETWQRRRILAVYLVATTILYADLALMAPNLSEIADEFGFDDDERDVKLGGYVALGFFSLSFPVALLIGWLADFCNRSPLYAATVFLGEAACLGTYFVQTYPQLFVTRLLTGVSISGALPVIFSVLGDLYPSKQRNAAAAVITTGTGLGTGVGQALAGFLGPTYGWRFPFLIVSVPGMACSLLLLLIRDPPRGRKEPARIELDLLALERIRERNEQQRLGNDEPGTMQQPSDTTTTTVENWSPNCPPTNESPEEIISTQEKLSGRNNLDRKPSFDPETCTNLNQSMKIEEEKTDSLEGGTENGDAQQEIETCHTPPKTAAVEDEDQKGTKDQVSWKTTKEMISTPTVALVLLGAAPGALPFGFGSVFLNDYLAEDRGMTVEAATGVLATFGAGNALGVIASGVFGHYAYKKDARLPPVIMGKSLIVSCVPMYFLINWVNGESSVAAVASIALLAGFFSVIPVPIERAILTNVTVPSSRGRANSFLGIIDDLGKGLGPALVSILIQAFDRPTAFNISLLGWVIGGFTSFAMVFFVKRDEELVQERIRACILLQNEGLLAVRNNNAN